MRKLQKSTDARRKIFIRLSGHIKITKKEKKKERNKQNGTEARKTNTLEMPEMRI